MASLGPKVALVIHPVPADPFDPGRWWQDPTDFGQTIWEYAALVDVWRRGLWSTVLSEVATIPAPVTVC